MGGDGQGGRLLRGNCSHGCGNCAGGQQLPGSGVHWNLLRYVDLNLADLNLVQTYAAFYDFGCVDSSQRKILSQHVSFFLIVEVTLLLGARLPSR